ncbi:hypothetical protein OIU85_007400 [Salix viminalis]|uniref:Molybdopterin oxidoreductase domain-containing protein n=1 Tax=Salix viminalis TaxID=40686 RepID=A0A9Q0SNL5_SALVM|nr:hypothetical protein OIU85_007400 [Salix viminalis]
MIRGTDGRFKVVSWHDAFAVVAEIAHQVKPEEIVGIAESMMALKDFLNKIGLENADVFLLVGAQAFGLIETLSSSHKLFDELSATGRSCHEGRHPFCSTLSNAKNPAIIVGAGLLERSDKDAIFSAAETIVKNGNVVRPYWNGFNVLLLNVVRPYWNGFIGFYIKLKKATGDLVFEDMIKQQRRKQLKIIEARCVSH